MDFKPTGFGLVLAIADNDILFLLTSTLEVVVKNTLDSLGIASLGIQSSTRVMGHHAISTSKRVFRRTPDVVLWSRLNVPYIASVAAKLTAQKGGSNIILVADGTTSGVNEPRAFFEMLQEVTVNESTGAFM